MSPTKKKRFQSVKEMLTAISNVRMYTGSRGSGICGSVEPEVIIVDPGSSSNSKPTPARKRRPQLAPKSEPARQLGWKWIISGVAAAAIIISVAIWQPWNKQQSISGTINGHDYVDLGLSVKWATQNVGASSPSDYGDYFAWGETETKKRFYWDNCFDCLDGTGDSWGIYKIGGKTSISPTSGHDTARENWGGSWRMPTDAEFEELCKKCTWTWTSQGVHKGYKVNGSNGNSIFLPAAGWRSGTGRYGVGEYGYYWSSTHSASSSCYACFLYFDSSFRYTDYISRENGRCVRPVTD